MDKEYGMKPESIQIQTIDYCNRKCQWCPNSKMEKSHSNMMSGEIFFKILTDLKDIDYQGKFHLYLMGEPLTDDGIVIAVRTVRRMFPENIIYIGTNGDYLDVDMMESLIDAGITWVGVSHYDDSNNHLYDLSLQYPMLVNTNVGTLRQTFYNRAGHVDISCISPTKECDWVKDKAYVNYRGEVILCCSDYNYEVVFGNVMDKSFNEIYNSEHYNEYRKMHKSGRGKKMPLCINCNRIISHKEARAI
jgi:radical SAM protein with 4Fe4S-binding SPASM domain